jgi:hypothetical protein
MTSLYRLCGICDNSYGKENYKCICGNVICNDCNNKMKIVVKNPCHKCIPNTDANLDDLFDHLLCNYYVLSRKYRSHYIPTDPFASDQICSPSWYPISKEDKPRMEKILNGLINLTEKKYFKANNLLSEIYYYAQGVDKNIEKAIKYINPLVEKGDKNAQNNLEAMQMELNPKSPLDGIDLSFFKDKFEK